MDPSSVTWVFEPVLWLADRFFARKEQDHQRKSEAIDALIEALTETKIYFGTQRVSGRDRPREETISRLWLNAAKHLEPYDSNFAQRCETKGTYWADPAYWTDEQIKRAEITLADVEISLQSLKHRLAKDKK